MDINEVRGILTAVTMFAFVGLWVFAWSKRRKADYDRSAALPLEEDQYITQEITQEITNNTRENE